MNTRRDISRIASLLLALLVLAIAASPLGASPPPQGNNPGNVTVMTRNLYLGADVAPVVAAALSGDPAAVVAAVSEVWGRVQFTDFPARADGIAREIAAAGPDLIGLQEAELWRSQTPAEFVMGNAHQVWPSDHAGVAAKLGIPR